jgi:hypothetical protein
VAIPTPTVSAAGGDQTVTPATIARTVAIGAPTIGAPSVVSPATVSRAVAIGLPDVEGEKRVNAVTVSRAVSIGAPTVTASGVASPATVARTVSVPVPAMLAGQGSLILPATIGVGGSVPLPLVDAPSGQPTAFAVRLVAYTPNGAYLGPLPQPVEFDLSFVHDDTGGLRLHYPESGAFAELLEGPLEIAVEYSTNNGQSWVEPYDGRFLALRRSGDPTERPGTITTECPSYVWRLSKAVVLPEGLTNAEGKRPFLSARAGTILDTLFSEAQARGGLAGITWDFTSTNDSTGAPWDQVITIYYEPGVTYEAVLRNLADQGMLDWAWQGRTLRCFRPDAFLGQDRYAAAGVALHQGRELTEAPFRGTREGLVNHVYLKGENGANLEITNTGAEAPWGRWEGFISQGGVSDLVTMGILVDAELVRGQQERVENTFGVAFNRDQQWLPFRDYRIGDKIGVRRGLLPMETMRVRSLTLQRKNTGQLVGNLVLNDRFDEADVRNHRRIQGITGGASAGGTGARPIDPSRDNTEPSAVTGLALTSASYVDATDAVWGQIGVSWAAVLTNVDSSNITDLSGYEIWHRRLGDAQATLATSVNADQLNAIVRGYIPGEQWYIKVRAFDLSGNNGAYTAESLITVADLAGPPDTPSQAAVTAALGQLWVEWNGKNAAGDDMPEGWSYTALHVSPTTGFTPSPATLYDTYQTRDGGLYPVAGLAYDTTFYVRLVAYDASGNASAPSVQASGIPKRVTGLDVEALAIETTHLGNGAITAAKIADATITTAKIGDAQIVGAKIANATIDDAKISNVSAGKITVGVLIADVTIGARIKTQNTGNRVEMNTVGFQAFNASNVKTFEVAAATGSCLVTGTFRTGATGTRVEIDASGSFPTIWLKDSGGGNAAFINSPGGGLGMNTADDGSTYGRLYLTPQVSQLAQLGAGTQDVVGGFVIMDDGGVQVGVAGDPVHGLLITGGGVQMIATSGGLTLTGDSGISATTASGSATFGSANNCYVFCNGSDTTINSGDETLVYGGNRISLYAGLIYIGAPSGNDVRSDAIYNKTATFAANVGIATSPIGVIYRLTSSERYKVDVRPAQPNLSWMIRQLEPVTYYDKGQYEANGSSTQGLSQQLGLIAERTYAVPALGPLLVELDKDGRPESVNYERVGVAALLGLSDLEARVTELERRLRG